MTDKQRQELMQNPEAMKAEMERCKDARYFYNNYYRKEGDPEYSEKEWNLELARIETRRQRLNARNPQIYKYPLTPEDCKL